MPLPRDQNARRFYRAAKERFRDAEYLLRLLRHTGAIYLAGYGVECMLKALLLSSVTPATRDEVLSSFRGRIAHDFEWLKQQYRDRCRATIPPELAPHFARVNTWTSDLRYQTGTVKHQEVTAFIESAQQLMSWADGRM